MEEKNVQNTAAGAATVNDEGYTHTHHDHTPETYEEWIAGEGHHHHHHHGEDDFYDYTQAVNAYKKSFSNKEKVIEQTPDPAVREMLLHMQELGVETVFDRFDQQQPQCSFGIAGICCKNCAGSRRRARAASAARMRM